jgi:hypothetical protein
MSEMFGWCQSGQHPVCKGRAGARLVCSCRCHGRHVVLDRPVVDVELPEEPDM